MNGITRGGFIKGFIVAMLAFLCFMAWEIGNDAGEMYYKGEDTKPIKVEIDGEDGTYEFLLADPTADIVFIFPSHKALATVEAFDIIWGTTGWECRPKEKP